MAPRFAVLLGLVLSQAKGEGPYPGDPDITIPLCVSEVSTLLEAYLSNVDFDPDLYGYGAFYYVRPNRPTEAGYNFIISVEYGVGSTIDEFGNVYVDVNMCDWMGGCDSVPGGYSEEGFYDGGIVEQVSGVFNLIQENHGIDGTCSAPPSPPPPSPPPPLSCECPNRQPLFGMTSSTCIC